MDGVPPSGVPGRRILELAEYNMYYNIVQKYTNMTTAGDLSPAGY